MIAVSRTISSPGSFSCGQRNLTSTDSQALTRAVLKAMQDLDVLVGDRHRGIHLIAMDKDGNHYGAANALDRTKHIYMTDEMNSFADFEGHYAPFRTDPKLEPQSDTRDGMR